jgi:hypothetical protein
MAAVFCGHDPGILHRVAFSRLPDDSGDRHANDARSTSDFLSINEPLDFQSRVGQLGRIPQGS